MEIKAIPGVFDILPRPKNKEWQAAHIWEYVEAVVRKTAKDFGYQEIRTPILERIELFKRSVGEATDIVSKEMYSFTDKGGREIALRPEGTAPVLRSFIENNLSHLLPEHKFFYICPMFRYERAQAGRYRQHHQFGAEALGNMSPEQDAEIIDLLYTTCTRLGLKDLQVNISSIGGDGCRKNYRQALLDYLKKYYNDLSDDSKKRYNLNPLRILDSKDAGDQKILRNAPSILDYLNDDDKEHFTSVLTLLDSLKIPYIVNDKIVRGIDYYSGVVFEVIAHELGAQNSVGAGGRYDKLTHQLGGPEIPALGFGAGLERIIQTMLKQNVAIPEPFSPIIFLIPLGDKASSSCFQILHDLRASGISAQMDFSKRKLKKIMQYANQIKAQFVAVIGDKELEKAQVELKDMETGETCKLPLFHLSRILKVAAKGEDFIRIWKQMNTPFEDPEETKFFLNKLENSIKTTSQLTGNLKNALEKMQELL